MWQAQRRASRIQKYRASLTIKSLKKDPVVVINSHVNTIGLKRCIESLIGATNPGKIVVVSGGEKDVSMKNYDTHWKLCVKQNSIDFTGLIAICEHLDLIQSNVEDFSVIFYTHDTIEVGSDFWTEIRARTMDKSIRLTRGATMNIGFYTVEHILKSKDKLLSYRSSDDPSMLELLDLKKKGVDWEGSLFDNDGSLCKKAIVDGNCTSVYDKGSCRIKEYYPEIQLTKFKANFQRKQTYSLA